MIFGYTPLLLLYQSEKKGYRRREHSLYEYALGCSRGRRKAERIKEAKERKLNFYISEFGSAHPVWPKKDQWWKLKDNPKDEHLKDNEYIQYVRVLCETGLHNLTLSIGYGYKGNFLSVEIMEKDKYWLMRNYTLLDEEPFPLAVF